MMNKILHKQIRLLIGWDTAMKKILHKQIILLILILLPIVIATSCYRLFNHPIKFYGLVLDEGGQPLPRVKIHFEISGDVPILVMIPGLVGPINRSRIVRTNKHGSFQVKGYYGQVISPIRFSKDGYELMLVGGRYPRSFWWHELKNNDPANPIIYKMRKVGETTFLWGGITRRGISAYFNTEHVQDETVYYDIIQDIRFGPERTLDNAKRPLIRDIKISGRWEESENRWAITFAPGTVNGGIQILNQKLYMAPETGYNPEVTFYVYLDLDYRQRYGEYIYLKGSSDEPYLPEMSEGVREYYFYLKSRDIGLYSRLAMRLPVLDRRNERYRLLMQGIEVTTNPFAGQRSLDMRQDIPYKVWRSLQNEVLQAFRKDPNATIPPPDLDALIKEERRQRLKPRAI